MGVVLFCDESGPICPVSCSKKKSHPEVTVSGGSGSRVNRGVDAVKPASSDSPPDWHIQIGSTPFLTSIEKGTHLGAFFYGAGYGSRKRQNILIYSYFSHSWQKSWQNIF